MSCYIFRLISLTRSRHEHTSEQDLQAKNYNKSYQQSGSYGFLFFIFVGNCLEFDDLCQITFYRRLSHSNKERRKGSDHVYLNFS